MEVEGKPIKNLPSHSTTNGVITHVSGIILAGGGSRRMGGVNKALIEVGGRRLINRVTEVLCRVFREVIVITNSPEEFSFLGLPLYRDIKPGRGALGGLYTGLSACAAEYGFLTACDMPFLNGAVIGSVVEASKGEDIIVPRIAGRLQPLHAIYSRCCLPVIEELVGQDDLKILNLFSRVTVKEIPEQELAVLDPSLRFVMNLNTPQDVSRARELAERTEKI